MSPLHQHVLAAKVSTDWAGRRNGYRSGRTPGTRNADDLGMLEFRRGLGRSYYPLLGLRLRLLGLLKLLLRRLLLLLLLVLGGGDNTNGARVGLAGGGVHVPDDDRGGLTTDDGSRRHYPLGVDQAGTDLIPHDRPSKAGWLILSTSCTSTTTTTDSTTTTIAPIAVAAIARVRVRTGQERLRWLQLSPQLMPIRAVLDDGLADLVAPLQIDRPGRKPCTAGSTPASASSGTYRRRWRLGSWDGAGCRCCGGCRNCRDRPTASDFDAGFAGSRSDHYVRSDGCGRLLGLLVR